MLEIPNVFTLSILRCSKRNGDCETYCRKQSNDDQPVVDCSSFCVNEAGIYSEEDHEKGRTYKNEINQYQVRFADFRDDKTRS
jgi:hypothetical protein